MEANGDVEDR